jgi:2-methylcitrate dehydratase
MHSEAAFYDLMDSLASALRALRDPGCARWLGPVVPGATMVFGARVPGTSYVLDPVQAAFNVGVLVGWPDRSGDAAWSSSDSRAAHTVAGVLVAADFLARQAIAEARTPLTLQDVLTRLAQARAIRQRLASAAADTGAMDGHALAVRVATAAVVAAMLDGTTAHVAHAVAYAWVDGDDRTASVSAELASECEGWMLAEAASRGVRLAWLARTAEPGAAVSRLPEVAARLIQPQQ